MDIINVNDVCLTLGKTEILKHINVSFEEGKIHGLIGRNGSGKTMLMKCICGFIKPTSGEITVDGKKVGKDVDFPKDMGIIIETPGFIKSFSGYDNLKYLASVRKMIGKEEIVSAMEKAGLDPAMKKHVGKYSLGMRQRLGIAQAIMEKPDILILDEPTNGLDKKGVEEFRNLILAFKKEGKTIILASHNAEDVRLLCDNVSELDGGRLIEV